MEDYKENTWYRNSATNLLYMVSNKGTLSKPSWTNVLTVRVEAANDTPSEEAIKLTARLHAFLHPDPNAVTLDRVIIGYVRVMEDGRFFGQLAGDKAPSANARATRKEAYEDVLLMHMGRPAYTPEAVVPWDRWVSVKDKLPDSEDSYLVCTRGEKGSSIWIADWMPAGYTDEEPEYSEWVDGYFSNEEGEAENSITHWQPLPTAPRLQAQQQEGGAEL
ncbi:DUF551 domain-containing protein [Hymenobacter sediminis]|uniref:DUF551 domain-containing protein n=1 Tax=Hymenobacter sediminis TaxID=2218621 RepID=UPI000DA6CCB5|nr:DUF551 domain-containing protein [Hymenobacter sediminis]RPD50024.1 DUF551 domain-containing protein [Hymenobacter sediminis]